MTISESDFANITEELEKFCPDLYNGLYPRCEELSYVLAPPVRCCLFCTQQTSAQHWWGELEMELRRLDWDTCKHPICQPSITMYMGCLQVSLSISLAQVGQNRSVLDQSDTCIHLFWPANHHNLPESRAGLGQKVMIRGHCGGFCERGGLVAYDKRDTCKHPICQPSITMYMGCLQVSLSNHPMVLVVRFYYLFILLNSFYPKSPLVYPAYIVRMSGGCQTTAWVVCTSRMLPANI